MTPGTALSGTPLAAVVCGVVEAHIKAFPELRRKYFDRWIVRLCVRMTNSAHRLVFATGELVKMTADAGLVAAEFAR